MSCRTCFTRLVSTAIAVVGTDLQITVPATTVLTPDTKYCLILATPLPEAGENLPVTILVSGGTAAIPVRKSICEITTSCGCHGTCTFGDQLFGIDLPERGRTRIPLFLTNDEAFFVDIRGLERFRRCGRD